jgi:hypothetical protein
MAKLKIPFTMRLNIETHAKLKKIAEAESRSITNTIDVFIKRGIASYEKEYGPIDISDELD